MAAYRATRHCHTYEDRLDMALFIGEMTRLWVQGELEDEDFRVRLASVACCPVESE